MDHHQPSTRKARFTLMIGVLLILALLGVNGYRAATQTLAHDEALAFNNFLSGRWTWALTRYNSGNHVLHTCAQIVTTRVLGVSEFSIRLPSVLSGGLYLIAALVLCRRAAGREWLSLMTFGLISINPMLLDMLSAARGYSMALAALAWAMVVVTRAGPARWWRIALVSLLCGMSLAANLAFVFPLVALAAVYFYGLIREGKPIIKTLLVLGLPGPIFAGLVLVMPLQLAVSGHFYVGSSSIIHMVRDLVAVSLWHWPVAEPTSAMQSAIGVTRLVIVPIVVIASAVVAIVMLARRRGRILSAGPAHSTFLVAMLIGLLAVIMIIIAANTAGMAYPVPRTGLYLFALFGLCLGGLSRYWLEQPASQTPNLSARLRQFVASVLAIVMLALVVRFAWQLQTDYYRLWHYDAQLKQVLAELDADRRAQGLEHVRLGGHYVFEPTVNFYRHHWQLDWLEPYTRDANDNPTAYDYLLFCTWSDTTPAELGMVELHRDRYETVLARHGDNDSPDTSQPVQTNAPN